MNLTHHLILADMSGLETAGLIGSLIFGGIGCIVAVIALVKKQDMEISPQPLAIQIVEELHERFPEKKAFEEHVANNTSRHAQIFSRIDAVERQARADLEKKMVELNEDRRRTLEKLNDQFVFIRENIAAVNRELQIRDKK